MTYASTGVEAPHAVLIGQFGGIFGAARAQKVIKPGFSLLALFGETGAQLGQFLFGRSGRLGHVGFDGRRSCGGCAAGGAEMCIWRQRCTAFGAVHGFSPSSDGVSCRPQLGQNQVTGDVT